MLAIQRRTQPGSPWNWKGPGLTAGRSVQATGASAATISSGCPSSWSGGCDRRLARAQGRLHLRGLGRRGQDDDRGGARAALGNGEVAGGKGTLGSLIKDEPGDDGIRKASQDLQVALANLRSITEKINEGEGTVGALIADPTIYENLVSILGGAQLTPTSIDPDLKNSYTDEYALGAEGEEARSAYAAVMTPIVSLSFTDA